MQLKQKIHEHQEFLQLDIESFLEYTSHEDERHSSCSTNMNSLPQNLLIMLISANIHIVLLYYDFSLLVLCIIHFYNIVHWTLSTVGVAIYRYFNDNWITVTVNQLTLTVTVPSYQANNW